MKSKKITECSLLIFGFKELGVLELPLNCSVPFPL